MRESLTLLSEDVATAQQSQNSSIRPLASGGALQILAIHATLSAFAAAGMFTIPATQQIIPSGRP
jgi:hypothetical protein